MNNQIMEPEEMLKIDLARVFGLQVNIVTKSVPTYVLKANSLFDKYESTSKQSVWHTSLNDSPKYVKRILFASLMERIGLLFSSPVVLEISPRKFVDLDLPDDIYSFNENQLIYYLNSIGIEVEKEVRELRVAVFSKVMSFSNPN